MKKLLGALLLVVSGLVHAQTIRFATEATYPPFEYISAKGNMKGFDIDIAKALCSELKAKCTFNNQSFASLIPALKLGKFDALISALGITPERQKQVAFTQPYYQPSAVFVAAKTNHYSLDSLRGKTIGVQQGSTFQKYLQDKFGSSITQKTYASIQDAFLDLVSGRIDLVISDTPIATNWLKQDHNSQSYAAIDKPIVDPVYFGAGYGIAVNKNNTKLLNDLNQALTTIKQNGTYEKITKEYF